MNGVPQAVEERIGLRIELLGYGLAIRAAFEVAGNFAGDQIRKFAGKEGGANQLR